MGKDVWTHETFVKSGLVNLDEISPMQAGLWGVYRIRVLVDGVLFHYTGSSVDMDGWYQRWHTHDSKIALGLEEIVRRRSRDDESAADVLFIHFLCALPGAAWSIHEVARFPALQHPRNLVWALKGWVHLFESCHMVFEGNIDGNYKHNFPGHETRTKWRGNSGIKGTTLLARALAPEDAPQISHEGANRALAMSQTGSKSSYKDEEGARQYEQVSEILREVFHATKSNFLSRPEYLNVIQQAKSKYGIVLEISHQSREKIRRWYRRILREYDVSPGGLYDGKLHQYYPLLLVLKDQLEKRGWVSKKPIDGFYQISLPSKDKGKGNFDWVQIAKDTQARVKGSKKDFYTPQLCMGVWRRLSSKTTLGSLMLFKPNWENITGKSL
jgi:hypothetical protein